MINVFYSNTREIDDTDIEWYLRILPVFMQEEILRYKYNNDRKLSLIARLMLFHSLNAAGIIELLDNWKRDNHNKPYIGGWKNFNISHSGEMVVFSYSDEPVGIDIEQRLLVDYAGLLKFLHPMEQEFITGAENIQIAFYSIWTKKEALLKAIGVGLVDKPEQYNCIGQDVYCNDINWQLQELSLHQDYSAHLCCAKKKTIINISAFSPNELLILH